MQSINKSASNLGRILNTCELIGISHYHHHHNRFNVRVSVLAWVGWYLLAAASGMMLGLVGAIFYGCMPLLSTTSSMSHDTMKEMVVELHSNPHLRAMVGNNI